MFSIVFYDVKLGDSNVSINIDTLYGCSRQHS